MSGPQTPEKAEIFALEALTWLVGEEDALHRFLDQSGLDLADLRAAAASPGTGLAVMEFLLAHEDLLIRFCESAGVEPKALHLARYRLGGAA